jgi:hypothetical protein
VHAAIASTIVMLAVAAPAQERELEQRFAAAVDEQRLLKTVRELVAIGARMGGTPSGDAAAKYHARRFESAGLAPVSSADPPLRAFQPLRFSATVAIAEESVALVDGALALHTKGCEKRSLPLLLRLPESADAAPSEPWALLVDAESMRTPLSWRKEKQPRALLVAFEQRVESSTPLLHQPGGCEGTLLSVSKREKAAIAAAIEAAGTDTPAELDLEAEIFEQQGRPVTVHADVVSAAKDAPILLFCAHGDSDSGSPGADDNGSGDAVVQELAAVFGKLAAEKQLHLPFTLRFLVWGSEIHSTNAYIARTRKDGSLARHLAVINFDQAGTGAERDCVYFEPDNLPLNQPLVRLGLEMAGEYCGKEGCWSEYTSNAALGGTDSYCFSPGWQQGGGGDDLPSITIFTAAFGSAEEPAITPGFRSPGWKGGDQKIRVDYSRVYHETGDRPETTTELEPWNMVWITKAAGLLALRLAASPAAVEQLRRR